MQPFRFTTRTLLTAAVASIGTVAATAQPTGGFIVGLDYEGNSRTDSPASVVFYDVDNLAGPLFSVYLGDEDGNEDPAAFTVNPETGLVYVAAFDSGTSGDVVTISSTGEDDTRGDLDLYTIDFTTIYNDWTANQSGYVQYVHQTDPVFGDPITPALTPSSTPQVLLPGAVTKVGEIARSNTVTADFPSTAFERQLEFIDENTLVLLDDDTDQTSDLADTDNEIRIIKRTDSAPTYNAATNEGGFTTGGATENWASTIVGRVNLDAAVVDDPDGIPDSGDEIFGPGKSSPENFAAYRDPVSGVTGVWIQENDGGSDQPFMGNITGDDIAFFEITNEDGITGNGYRPITFDGVGSALSLDADDNPTIDEFADNGAIDRIFVNRDTGEVLYVESGFFDGTQDEPSVITADVQSYDDGSGQIDFGSDPWSFAQLADGLPGDDDTLITDGRTSVYDHVNNDVYFLDRDNPGAGGSFDQDWFKLDLDTGVSTLVATDSDNLIFFDQGDHLEFFFLGGIDPEFIAGDYNGDGFVSQADLDLVLLNWGDTTVPAEWLASDQFDGTQVSQNELDGVLLNWGNGTPPPSATIPEPASLALLGAGGLLLTSRRRRG